MRNLKRAFWGTHLVLLILWLIAEPTVLQSTGFSGPRRAVVQLTGIVAIACMSLAMVLALRPLWPQAWLGGLDKMYRLHKWLGISSLAIAIIHWLWAKWPDWVAGSGRLERPVRGPRGAIEHPVAAWLSNQRSVAEHLGEWAFYAIVVLIAAALVQRIPYRLFYKTHRLLALAYLALAFHAIALMRFAYWASPVGWLTAALLAGGTWAAVMVLLRRVGVSRRVEGTILSLHRFAEVRSLEIEAEARGWPGHKPGQFAFATFDASEGAHPYTIASGWRRDNPRITFVVKELGDHTDRLRENLHVGQAVTIEGPYGCFTFDDGSARQIWIGGGIGITPFIGRMKQMAQAQADRDWPAGQQVDLFHSTADVDPEALDKLAADAKSANVRLHLLIDSRDGLLTGERLRAAIPDWREASIWFCGPAAFGDSLKRDLAAHGYPVDRHFHQELFAMR
ncbi:MAG: ferric reductase-like transmembrane domain-containing protein [Burkholderiaceae bacterium]|jgi:predicted ferric reductase|nr:ferric reductase-like transmembrane domain-containing protein [Burkholderiaceae bacterium]MEB2320717.1 ferric reductase-like transmembrane domain-containing protein [Pseudomonadota bacterium]